MQKKMFFSAIVLSVLSGTTIASGYTQDLISKASDQGLISPQDNQFDREAPLTYTEFSDVFSQILCTAYTPQTFNEKSPQAFVNRGEFVTELWAHIESKINRPADWQTMLFYDIPENTIYKNEAQILSSIGILPRSDGFFGIPSEPNPPVTYDYFFEVLSRVTDLETCGFLQQADQDQDFVPDEDDLCPRLPAKNTENGCPQFNLRKPKYQEHETPKVYVMDIEAVDFTEITDVRLGDIFFLAITDPKTGEIFSKSNEVQVRY